MLIINYACTSISWTSTF